ncbi:hypothetical protein B566_EDAN012807 [Ephemera danica]|nr:hypothetical protein B566_EDAN012807 [Ephemera danica]
MCFRCFTVNMMELCSELQCSPGPLSSASSTVEEDEDYTVEQDKIYTCRWASCGCCFSSLAMLGAHVTHCHAQGGESGLFFCCWQGCNRSHRAFNARYKMLVHVRTHTNEKPHSCSECHKTFSRSENLKIHYRSHTGERPYLCPVEGCSKAYSNSSDRFKHVRTHAVDKPYVCKLPGCGKRYTDPSSLRKHVKTTAHRQPWLSKHQQSSCSDQESPLDLTLKSLANTNLNS